MTANVEELQIKDAAADEPEVFTSSTVVTHVLRGASDPTSLDHMAIIEASGALDFWDDPREDIYSLEDGEPV